MFLNIFLVRWLPQRTLVPSFFWCAWVCAGVHGCAYAWVFAHVWDEFSEFLLDNRVPTSATAALSLYWQEKKFPTILKIDSWNIIPIQPFFIETIKKYWGLLEGRWYTYRNVHQFGLNWLCEPGDKFIIRLAGNFFFLSLHAWDNCAADFDTCPIRIFKLSQDQKFVPDSITLSFQYRESFLFLKIHSVMQFIRIV